MTKPNVTRMLASAGNFSRGRMGTTISMVVIHTEQGSAAGTAAWFQDPLAHVSAHYGVSIDGSIEQYVADADEAWHAGNAAYNRCSIGIELEGFEESGSFPMAQLDSLGQLCVWLCSTYGIPADRRHLIGHCEVPDPHDPLLLGGAAHHTDPGVLFPWGDLMHRIISTTPTV